MERGEVVVVEGGYLGVVRRKVRFVRLFGGGGGCGCGGVFFARGFGKKGFVAVVGAFGRVGVWSDRAKWQMVMCLRSGS